MNRATLLAMQELDAIRLLTRETVLDTVRVTSITEVDAQLREIKLNADLSEVVAGHVISLYGNQDRYEEIAAVNPGASDTNVVVSDSDLVASGAVGEASVFRWKQRGILDNIVTAQVWPWIEAKTRQSFTGKAQVRELYSGNGTSELMLDRRYIQSVDKIELLTLPHDILSIPISSIEVVTGRGLLRVRAINLESFTTLAPIWPKGDNNVAITYTYGFDEPPADVQKAAALLACSFYLSKESNVTGGGTQITVEGYSRTFGKRGKWAEMRSDYAIQAMALLKKYMTGITSRG